VTRASACCGQQAASSKRATLRVRAARSFAQRIKIGVLPLKAASKRKTANSSHRDAPPNRKPYRAYQ